MAHCDCDRDDLEFIPNTTQYVFYYCKTHKTLHVVGFRESRTVYLGDLK